MTLVDHYKKATYRKKYNAGGTMAALGGDPLAIAGAIGGIATGIADAVDKPDQFSGMQGRFTTALKAGLASGNIGALISVANYDRDRKRGVQEYKERVEAGDRLSREQTGARIMADPSYMRGNRGAEFFASGGTLGEGGGGEDPKKKKAATPAKTPAPAPAPAAPVAPPGAEKGPKFYNDPMRPFMSKMDLVNTILGMGVVPGKVKYGQILAGQDKNLYTDLQIFNQRTDVLQMTPEQRVEAYYNTPSNNPYVDEYRKKAKGIGYGILPTYRSSPDVTSNLARVNPAAALAAEGVAQATPPATQFEKGGSLADMYLTGGTAKPLSSTHTELVGRDHAEGGIQVPALNAEVEGGETTAGNYVFSEALGFAQKHKPIAKAIGKIEKKPPTRERLTALNLLRTRENELRNAQEAYKLLYNA